MLNGTIKFHQQQFSRQFICCHLKKKHKQKTPTFILVLTTEMEEGDIIKECI